MLAEAPANPLLQPWTGPLGSPPFDRVRPEQFLPAFETAIAQSRAGIEAIASNNASPTFDNVIAALERSGGALARVRRLFWTLASAQSGPELRAIEGEVSAMLTRHGTQISHDPALFARVAAVWKSRESAGLTPEQRRLVENSYRGFLAGGAGLDPADKARFAQIDQELGTLSVQFGQNVLAATKAWTMVLEASEMEGIPDDVVRAAAARAEAAGLGGRYLMTLGRGDFESLLTFSPRRDLREQMWRAFTTRCDGGVHDNNALVARIVALRQERAELLGYASFADYKLEDSMAKTPGAAEALMLRVWRPALQKAEREAARLQELVDQDGGGFILAPWDWRYYAERIRRETYQVDTAALRSHLGLEKVRDAAFQAAGRLFGLQFNGRPDVATYHPDVQAWEVRDRAGETVGLLFTDYLARPEKHGGAWMGSLRVQERMDEPILPIVYTVANFTRPAAGEETLLSLDEARTLFHEFGHALHGLLSDVTYPSLAGTAVARDFVEFPSKLMEHWVAAPEALRELGVPDGLVAAISGADTFGQGYASVEFLGSALVDLAIHRRLKHPVDAARFERDTLATLGAPPAIPMRHRLPHFTHVFDGGYASAYYSYLWAEVLDADTFAAFVASGNIYDAGLADRYRREVLARGDARDPMESFVAFRGRSPDEAALVEARGLAEAI